MQGQVEYAENLKTHVSASIYTRTWRIIVCIQTSYNKLACARDGTDKLVTLKGDRKSELRTTHLLELIL